MTQIYGVKALEAIWLTGILQAWSGDVKWISHCFYTFVALILLRYTKYLTRKNKF